MSQENRASCSREMFWMTPELASNLFPYLDLMSIKHLAEFHELTRKIFRNAFTWNKLIKRTFPDDVEVNVKPYGVPFESDKHLVSEKPKAKLLADILSLIQNSPGSQLEVDLIHFVCQRYPQSVPTSRVDVICACLENHVVSPRGIVLLEEIQAITGSCLLEVDSYQGIFVSGPLLTALGSIAARQQGRTLTLRPFLPSKFEVICCSPQEAEAFANLASSIESVRVVIFGYIFRGEGWAAIHQAVDQMADSSAVQEINVESRATTSQGFREDMEGIWEKVSLWRVFNGGWYLVFSKEINEERGVKGLTAAFHMTYEDFQKEAQKWGGGYDDGNGVR